MRQPEQRCTSKWAAPSKLRLKMEHRVRDLGKSLRHCALASLVSSGAAPRDQGIARRGTVAPSVTPTLSTVLVSMPFMDADRPSIQLGLLTSIANGHGFPTRAVHANLEFAAQLGVDDYRKLADHRGCLIGDWLFSVEAFGDAAPDPDGALLDQFADALDYLGPSPSAVRAWLLAVRSQDVPKFLDAMVNLIDWQRTDVVGFTSSFQQNAASFALARRLKTRHPRLVTVFGGANFDGDMALELVRSVDCIDVAVVGEADETFPRLLSALAAGEDPGPIPGVVSRLSGALTATPPAPVGGLDASPVPDYDDYFDRAERLGLCRERLGGVPGFRWRHLVDVGGAKSIIVSFVG